METENAPVLHIRRAKEHEAAAIAAVLMDAFASYEPLYTPEAFAATTLSPEKIEQRLLQNEGPVWVAVKGDAVVGTVSAVCKGTALYIRSMAILPAARGAGIGRNLLEELARFAGEQQLEYMYLSTTPFLLPAIRLYENFGFSKTGVGPHELYGTPLFTMVKILPETTMF